MAEMFKIKVEGVKELQAKFDGIERELEKALADAVSQAAIVVEREAKANSERGGNSFPHRITGNLMNSIKELRQISQPGRVESQIGTAVEYGPRLEYGFMDTDRLGRRFNQRPRPFLRPALDENEAEIQAAFEKSINAVLVKYR